MGTSSSRNGKKDNHKKSSISGEQVEAESNVWLRLKRAATSYFSDGNMQFSDVCGRYVEAIGGVANHHSRTNIKYRRAIASVLAFYHVATSKGIKAAFEANGVKFDKDNINESISLLIDNVYPDAITPEDVANRETFTETFYEFVIANSDNEEKISEEIAGVSLQKAIESQIVNSILLTLESNCPKSLEQPNSTLVKKQHEKAKREALISVRMQMKKTGIKIGEYTIELVEMVEQDSLSFLALKSQRGNKDEK